MKTIHSLRSRPDSSRRGTALLLSLLLLFVLVALVFSISMTTNTDARVARNDVTLTSMDLAIESALLQVHESLKTDADVQAAGADPTAAAAPGATGGDTGAKDPTAAAAGGGESEASDSRRDEWAKPQRTEINEIKLRIWSVDEDSKYNVLNLLNPDEKEADAAYERIVRILDLCREGTRVDIDRSTAEQMAKSMREHLTKRRDSKLPKPTLLSDLEKNDDVGMPLSLREFSALPPFETIHFQDFRDQDGAVVHAIDSFLTVWTSLGIASSLPAGAIGAAGAGSPNASKVGSAVANSSKSGSSSSSKKKTSDPSSGSSSAQTAGGGASSSGGADGAAGAAGAAGSSASGSSGGSGSTSSGGYAVNVNTASNAVLHGLADGREVNPRIWDEIVEYRNLEEEDEDDKSKNDESSNDVEEDIELDEYGREVLKRRIFESLSELSEVEGYKDLAGEAQTKLNALLTTKSNVFSIYIVARKTTSAQGDTAGLLDPVEQRKREETSGDSLVRVVRSVVWRHKSGEDMVITPILRWEVLDYLPYEILDFPDDER